MRVLISVQNYYPAYSFGGRVMNAVALAEGLKELGHDITVLTSSVIDRVEPPSKRTRIEYLNGVRVVYLGTLCKIGTVSLNPTVLPFSFSEVGRFDAAHVIGLYDALGPFVALAARRAQVPYSVEPSGMLVPIVRNVPAKRAYHSLFGNSMLKGARAVVVTSQVEGREAVEFGIPSEKLFFRRNGIDLREYQTLHRQGTFRQRLGLNNETRLILWLGRIEKKKNLEQLLEAVAGLKNTPWALAIVGPSESASYLHGLQRAVCDLSIEERVHFVSDLYGAEKLAAYADADLFVLVSISENWGNTVQEAIAAGVPVLVTRSCGVAEVVEGRGGLVVDLNVFAIRSGLERLLTDAKLYQTMKDRLPALASDLSWDFPVLEMARLFESWRLPCTENAHL